MSVLAERFAGPDDGLIAGAILRSLTETTEVNFHQHVMP
jgi:hypothetical protein